MLRRWGDLAPKGRIVFDRKRSVGHDWPHHQRSAYVSTTHGHRCPQKPRHPGSRKHRRHVSQRLRARLADRRGCGLLLALPSRPSLRFLGAHGAHELRRLRLHGLIARVKKSNRYQLTERGIQVALFFTRSYARLLRPGLAQITGQDWEACSSLRSSFDQLLRHIDQFIDDAKLAA